MALLPRTRTRVLLTGNRGRVGRWLGPLLKARGYDVRGFDVRDGFDVTDAPAITAAARSVDVMVHLATLAWDFGGTADEMHRVNVDGTRNVLAAAEAAGHARVVAFSSPHVFGILTGEAVPVSFPIRDDHPRLAATPYGASKVAVEDLCAEFTARTGIATFCPRPFWVWVPGQAADIRREWLKHSERERASERELGTFVDVRDVASAVALTLQVPASGHHRFILCAEDVASLQSTREVIRAGFPTVPEEDGWPPEGNERTALADSSLARRLLGWQPIYSWEREASLSRVQRAWGRFRRAPTVGLFPR